MGEGFLGKITRFFRNKELNDVQKARLAEERIDEIVDKVEAEGLIDQDAHEMIRGVLYLSASTVREVMVPRTEVVAASIDTPLPELLSIFMNSGHSRIPVYKESIDRIKGMIYVKDLLQHWGSSEIDLASILREPYFIPETKRLDDLLDDFRKKRLQIAVVIDEYGGTSGLVSIEDILEEIVGEISDEYDDDPKLLHVLHPSVLIVSSRLEIDELFEHFDLEGPEGKFSTVGGWIFDATGYIPQQGEKLHIPPFELRIESADERTIKRVRVHYKKDRPQSE